MSRWEECDYWNAPICPGVYVIFAGQEVIYVGSSCNLRGRLRAHRVLPGYGNSVDTPWGPVHGTQDCKIKIKRSRQYGDWAMQELRLIRRLQPRFNIRSVSPRKVAS